jgi:hypothetical protein
MPGHLHCYIHVLGCDEREQLQQGCQVFLVCSDVLLHTLRGACVLQMVCHLLGIRLRGSISEMLCQDD